MYQSPTREPHHSNGPNYGSIHMNEGNLVNHNDIGGHGYINPAHLQMQYALAQHNNHPGMHGNGQHIEDYHGGPNIMDGAAHRSDNL